MERIEKEKNIFCSDYKVNYYDVDQKHRLKVGRLISVLQGIATMHTAYFGQTSKWYKEQKKAWLLLNWQLKINRMPMDNEETVIKSWAHTYKGLRAHRAFEMQNTDGEVLVLGESCWVLYDAEKQKPARPDPEKYHDHLVSTKPAAIPEATYKIPKPQREENAEKEIEAATQGSELKNKERQFTVTRRDIDTNNHVNNSSYVEWAMDDIPEGIFVDGTIKELIVEYKHQSFLGMNIISKTEEWQTEKRDEFLVENSETRKQESA
ncbi:MAG: acyl-[acyl-carrier-protein] thioesterase, partial [Anaerovoracaceae bacterium]